MVKVLVGVLVIPLLVYGCAATLSHGIPTQAPAGRSATLVSEDTDACEKQASAVKEDRKLLYTACMISRGYTAYVEVPMAGMGGHVSFDVAPKGAKTQDQVMSDLQTCRKFTASELDKDTWVKVMVWGGAPAWQMPTIENNYGSCMDQRGYAVTRWHPKQ